MRLPAKVGDRRRLFKAGGLKELKEIGLVAHHRRLGYYRPDAPAARIDPVDGTKGAPKGTK